MTDDLVPQAVARAVGQAYDNWAAQHPSLSAVIDHIAVTDRTIESLRDSDQFRQAVAGYHQGMSEVELLDRLTGLAETVLVGLLAG